MLTIIPTPIGNLEDITLRALRVLREADIIACEDTRTSSILLRRYNINQAVLVPFHIHNENKILPELLKKLRDGKNIAVISDAGMPGISDPGWILLKRAIDENLDIDVLPGASAVLPAVLLSGITPHPFLFYGFPPEKSGERVKLFNDIKILPYTLCFYVSPHKAIKDINDMIKVFGDRNAALVREISKVYQEAVRGRLSEILIKFEAGLKGEMVLVIEGQSEKLKAENDEWRDIARDMKLSGETMKNIVKKINSEYGARPNEIKEFLMTD